MITPGRLLYLVRRDLSRGLSASWHYHRTTPKILDYRCPRFSREPATVPVHLLTGKDDWLMALWTLASFHYFTQRNWTVVIHDDGTLPGEAIAALQRAFPSAKIIARSEADIRLQRLLAPFPHCWTYRQSHPLGLKIFDMAALTRSERFIVLDSDLLFFARPDEVLDWVENRRDTCHFLQDVAEASNVSAEEAKTNLGIDLWPRVNSGLCLLQRGALDPAFCERVFEQTSILEGHIWRVEQTLFAACASRAGHSGLLPPTYEVTLSQNATVTATARHYVGAVRAHFYREGLPRLEKLLLGDAQ